MRALLLTITALTMFMAACDHPSSSSTEMVPIKNIMSLNMDLYYIYILKTTEVSGTCGRIEAAPFAVPSEALFGKKPTDWGFYGLKCHRGANSKSFRCDGNNDFIVGAFSADENAIEATETATRKSAIDGEVCTSSWRIEGRRLDTLSVAWPPR